MKPKARPIALVLAIVFGGAYMLLDVGDLAPAPAEGGFGVLDALRGLLAMGALSAAGFLFWHVLRNEFGIGHPRDSRGPRVESPILVEFGGDGATARPAAGRWGRRTAVAPPPVDGPVALLRWDPSFSEPVMLAWVQQIFALLQRGRAAPDDPELRMVASQGVLEALRSDATREDLLEEVEPGEARLLRAIADETWLSVQAEVTGLVVERRGDQPLAFVMRERWNLRRRTDGPVLPPLRLLELACPVCGVAADPNAEGRCPGCGTSRINGDSGWEIASISDRDRRPLMPPPLILGWDPDARLDTPNDPDPSLESQKANLAQRLGSTALSTFESSARRVVRALLMAVDDRNLEAIAAHAAPALANALRFKLVCDARLGLARRLTDVTVLTVELSRIIEDPYYTHIAARVRIQSTEWTEDEEGNVYAGSKVKAHVVAERWTFQRPVSVDPLDPERPVEWLPWKIEPDAAP